MTIITINTPCQLVDPFPGTMDCGTAARLYDGWATNDGGRWTGMLEVNPPPALIVEMGGAVGGTVGVGYGVEDGSRMVTGVAVGERETVGVGTGVVELVGSGGSEGLG